MKRTARTLITILSLALSSGTLTAADKAEVDKHYNNYHAAGKAIVEMTISKKVDAAEVEKKVQTLLDDSVWLATEYGKAFPKGEKLLKVVTENVGTMKKLSFKELEHEWHDLNHFTKSGAPDLGLNIKDEDNEHFTDPIHAIVHPLLVLKAAQAFATSKSDEELKTIKEEMEEGLEQVEKCRNALNKK